MRPYATTSFSKFTVGLCAVATGVAAVTIGAGTAQATCISISGVGNGGGCTSTAGSIAIAIGANATASTKGALNMALAVGSHATAFTVGTLNNAVALGDYAVSEAGLTTKDIGNVSLNITPGSVTSFAISGGTAGVGTGVGNVAVNLGGSGNETQSVGQLNTSVNVGGTGGQTAAAGSLNRAMNMGGAQNIVYAVAGGPHSPGLSHAFNMFGSHNYVGAGNLAAPTSGGPFAVAGTIGVSNHDGSLGHKPIVTQQHTGVNVKTPLNNN